MTSSRRPWAFRTLIMLVATITATAVIAIFLTAVNSRPARGAAATPTDTAVPDTVTVTPWTTRTLSTAPDTSTVTDPAPSTSTDDPSEPATPSETATPPTLPTPDPTGPATLPVTGPNAAFLLIVGGLLVAGGGIILAVIRRARRVS